LIVALDPEETFAYVGNWFTGQVGKLDLQDGQLKAVTEVAEKCMAGMAVFP
jgi:hypothetical protein